MEPLPLWKAANISFEGPATKILMSHILPCIKVGPYSNSCGLPLISSQVMNSQKKQQPPKKRRKISHAAEVEPDFIATDGGSTKSKRKRRPKPDVQTMFTAALRPTKDQKKKLDRMFAVSNVAYNWCKGLCQAGLSKPHQYDLQGVVCKNQGQSNEELDVLAQLLEKQTEVFFTGSSNIKLSLDEFMEKGLTNIK